LDSTHLGDLKEQLEAFTRGIAVVGCPPQNIPTAPTQEATAEVANEKKPVGRPRKAPETVAAEPTTIPTSKPEPKPEAKVEKPKKYTLDQVRSALQTYAQKVDPDASVGILKVRELLAQFQSTKHVPCQKISEVQDQDYAALVAACGA
jgi:hypothetical protein